MSTISSGNPNLIINGVNTGAQNVREITEGVTLEQIQQAIDGDGYDSLVYEQDGKAYIAWGDNLNFEGLEGLAQGDTVNAKSGGKNINLVLFENEVNSASEGVGQAWELGKKGVVGGGKMFLDQGVQIVGAGVTLGMFARWGGAKTAQTLAAQTLGKAAVTQATSKAVGHVAGQAIAESATVGSKSLFSKAGTWLFGPAQPLTGSAMKGLAKAGKWAAIGAVVVAGVGTAGLAIYGGNRSHDVSGIDSITKK